VTSFTSGSDNVRAAAIIASSVLILIAVEITLRLFSPDEALWRDLDFPPDPDKVLIIGNSMFKTGVDLARFHDTTGQTIEFNYFDGYYTNLWYLIVKNALSQNAPKPRVLIWGFRPTYAILPAFRQRKNGYIEHFKPNDEPEYDAITEHTVLPWQERVDLLLNRSYLYAARVDARNAVLSDSKQLAAGVLFLFADKDDTEKERIRNTSVSDLLLAAVTADQVRMSEELVADVAGPQDDRFITGERVAFEDSFVPRIAGMLADAGISQMVVIFKPVSQLDGSTPEDVIRFKEDAIREFQAAHIPVVDVFDDLELGRSDYGRGDHYNESGRNKVTDFIASAYLKTFGDRTFGAERTEE